MYCNVCIVCQNGKLQQQKHKTSALISVQFKTKDLIPTKWEILNKICAIWLRNWQLKVGILLTGIRPYVCVYHEPGTVFPASYIVVLCLCSVSCCERWLFVLLILEEWFFVRFFGVCNFVITLIYHHCLNFPFIANIHTKTYTFSSCDR